MPHHDGIESLVLYADLMGEAKVRLFATEGALQGKTGLTDQLVREFSLLQLRFVCELIALGCLTAHGDVPGTTTRMRREWHAGAIIRKLSALHPCFYPRPIVVRKEDRAPATYGLTDKSNDHLTKEDLLRLYEFAGESLHKGSVKNLMSPANIYRKNLSNVAEWTSRTRALLACHLIDLHPSGKDHYLICVLGETADGPVHAAYANSAT